MNSYLSRTWEKFKNPEYRRAFINSQLNILIPFQIRALMKQRGLTQCELAELAGMRQPSISQLMRPGEKQPNLKTLLRLAQAFDCALAVRFVPYSELLPWSDRFSQDDFSVPSFAQDIIEPPQHTPQPAVVAARRVAEPGMLYVRSVMPTEVPKKPARTETNYSASESTNYTYIATR